MPEEDIVSTSKTETVAGQKTEPPIQCGMITDLKMGVAHDNADAGMLVEFLPSLGMPPLAFVLAPHMAVRLRKALEEMETEFRWAEDTKPPVLPEELSGSLMKQT